jgi:hypothetical protein
MRELALYGSTAVVAGIHVLLYRTTMLAQAHPVIGGEDDDVLLSQGQIINLLHHRAHPPVH